MTWPFTREDWFALPLAVRVRWWRETDYSRAAPSDELLSVVREHLRRAG